MQLGQTTIQGAEHAPKKPNPFQRYKGAFWSGLVFLALLSVLLVAYIIFLRGPGGPTDQAQVAISINAPETSVSGSEVFYEISIDNNSRTQLTGLVLEVFYPRGFQFLEASIESMDNERIFELEDLQPGQQKKIVIVGRLQGSIQEIKTIAAKLRYVPQNFRSPFEIEAEALTVVLAPDLELDLHAPAQLFTGQIVNYDLTVSNLSPQTFSEIVLRVDYPDSFTFSESTPEPVRKSSDAAGEWLIRDLRVGESRKVTVSGLLSEQPFQESLIQAELFVKDKDGSLLSAGRNFAFTQIRPSPLRLTQRVNFRGTGQAGTVLIGENLAFVVDYENIGQTGLNNVIISLNFDTPDFFDLKKFRARDAQLTGNTLRWIPAVNPELLTVLPGEQGSFNFTVRVADDLVDLLKQNPLLATSVNYIADELPDALDGNTLEVPVATEVSLTAVASSLGGNRYRVTLEVSNTVNDVAEAVLSALIPGVDTELVEGSVSPQGEVPNLRIVPTAGQLSWLVGDIFAFTGTFHEKRRLTFDLESSSSVLLSEIKITGIDEFTGNEVASDRVTSLRAP